MDAGRCMRESGFCGATCGRRWFVAHVFAFLGELTPGVFGTKVFANVCVWHNAASFSKWYQPKNDPARATKRHRGKLLRVYKWYQYVSIKPSLPPFLPPSSSYHPPLNHLPVEVMFWGCGCHATRLRSAGTTRRKWSRSTRQHLQPSCIHYPRFLLLDITRASVTDASLPPPPPPPVKDHPLMRDTSFLTLRAIPIFPAESYHRSSSAKSDDGSPTVDLSQLNFVTCARRHIRSTTSLLRLSPIKFHSEGKIDRPFDASCFDDSCGVFRSAINGSNGTSTFHMLNTHFSITSGRDCSHNKQCNCLYFKFCSFFFKQLAHTFGIRRTTLSSLCLRVSVLNAFLAPKPNELRAEFKHLFRTACQYISDIFILYAFKRGTVIFMLFHAVFFNIYSSKAS